VHGTRFAGGADVDAESHPRYNRDKLRYRSDPTNREWTLVEPLTPLAKHGVRRRRVVVREVMKCVMYVLSTGCHRRARAREATMTQWMPRRSRRTGQAQSIIA
jgi:transposase